MSQQQSRRLKIFTWHIHGSYLFYLSQGNFDIYIPVNQQRTSGYVGRGETFPFGANVIEVPANVVSSLDFDVILYQTDENYLVDQFDVLSETQRNLPRIYLEHDPPWQHPTNTKHPVTDAQVLLVHVTHFNALMWDGNGLHTRIIAHGITPSVASYSGELAKGIVVINHLPTRGRLLGFDIFEQILKEVPIDLVGMGAEAYGIGEVLHPNLPAFIAKYRFFFNPIRYTSLGLAVCEAMHIGMPIVGLATTEMVVTIPNGMAGFIHTDPSYLIDKMNLLLENKEVACQMGEHAKQIATDQFNIDRFITDWNQAFAHAIAINSQGVKRSA